AEESTEKITVSGNYNGANTEVNLLDAKEFQQSHLQAFEERAIQKVNEFAEYLRIMADTGHALELREQAYVMALDQFDEKAKVATEDLEMPIHLFLQYVLASDTSYGAYSITEIQVDSILTKSKRKGVLTCTITGLEGGSANCTVGFKLNENENYSEKKSRRCGAFIWGILLLLNKYCFFL
ncbi:MAG: hypothetical protein JKY42_04090, partial [Flavobacteriales bacterium]|nr:hypothetical protein [Flavobacteriales bacterium]